MPLKSETVEWIFTRMGIRYGAAWRAKWSGVPMGAVARDWAEELENCSTEAIGFALRYLPLEYPPTVGEFLATCRRCPEPTPEPVRIEGPPADPQRVAQLVSKALQAQKARPPRQWAHDLQEREKAGATLSDFKRLAWREALRTDPVEMHSGWFTPIDPACLPPGMRQEQV